MGCLYALSLMLFLILINIGVRRSDCCINARTHGNI